jgi:hypothetical protein
MSVRLSETDRQVSFLDTLSSTTTNTALKEPIYDALRENLCLLLDIDVAGAPSPRPRGHAAARRSSVGFVDFSAIAVARRIARRLESRATDSQP